MAVDTCILQSSDFYDILKEVYGKSNFEGIKDQSLQHLVFPGGHERKSEANGTWVDRGDRRSTGVNNVIWP